MAKYGKGAGKMVEKEMRKMKKGNRKIKSRKQAIAVGLSEARSKGVKVPKKGKRAGKSKKTKTAKRTTRKSKRR